MADNSAEVLRISIDAKAIVKIGEYSRGGKTRIEVEAADHDFEPESILIPYGILLPKYDDLYLYFTESKATSDFIVDALDESMNILIKMYEPKMVVINLDNGPENNSHRTQFMKRMQELANKYEIILYLAYYPPYHSKYNPIERTWAVLENHWNGALLDKVDTAISFAKTMTWKGKNPVVKMITKIYKTGVKLAKKEMGKYEKLFIREQGLEKWFVQINPCLN